MKKKYVFYINGTVSTSIIIIKNGKHGVRQSRVYISVQPPKYCATARRKIQIRMTLERKVTNKLHHVFENVSTYHQ